jgi:glycolate oxidase
MALEKSIYRAFEAVVGPDNISDDPAILDSYAFRWGPEAETFAQRFEAVTLPQNTEEVQAIVRLCNRHNIQYKASSTGWGSLSNPHSPCVIKMDLRRMNRIIEINEENMYAVVEPYVISAELQAELMKRGFNCNVIGAGANCSAHPYAAHAGIGHMGETASYRERNLLAVEWVAPDGEIIKLGSLGSLDEWFCGDGPGPSLRGITVGTVAPLGGLGVFTKAATKIYHWEGPPVFPVEGVSPHYAPSEIPPNFFYRYFSFPSVEKMLEAQRKIGESEIAFEVMGFTPAMLASNIGTSNDEDFAYFEQFRKLVQGPCFQVIIVGNSPEDFEYKKQVLQQIMDETGGKSLKQVEDPKIAGAIMWRSIRITASIRECFRAGGPFTAVLGGTHPFAEEVHYLEKVAEVKKDLIKKGLFRDDGGKYLTWSHEHGHLGHAEMLLQFHPTPEVVEAMGFLQQSAVKIAVDTRYGVPHHLSGAVHDVIGPHASNYHLWQRRLKQAFDPKEVSEPSGYISGKSKAP